MIKVLFLGDVFGRPGRRLVREVLPSLVDRHDVDLVIANGENASGGLGLSVSSAEELLGAGIHGLTSGNHIFRHNEIYDYLDREPRLIRPANYPDPCPGRGSMVLETASGVPVGVINVQGRTFMDALDCPFRAVDRELTRVREAGAELVLVDFHAEATSEKRSMAWYLDGRVSALVGTHTHVQTADEEILPGGTGYLTDAGMTGPHRSVIGMKPDTVLTRFLHGRPSRFEVAKRGLRLEGAIFSLRRRDALSENIVRIQEVLEK